MDEYLLYYYYYICLYYMYYRLLTAELNCFLKSICGFFSSFQTIVSKYGSQFRGNSQHDALEFLLWLLDRVHEDVNLTAHNNNNTIQALGKVRWPVFP